MRTSFKLSLLAAAAASVLTTTGCAPLIFGGAVVAGGTTVSSATDRRSTGAQVNDGILETRVRGEILRALGSDAKTHYSVTAYNGSVLLAGEIATAAMKAVAVDTARASLDVKRVLDEVAVMEPVSVGQRMSDSTLATKVRSNIIANQNVSINQLKITVERGIVYVMGLLTPEENRMVCEIAAKTSGVVKVVSHAELLNAERIEKMRQEEAARKARLAEQKSDDTTP